MCVQGGRGERESASVTQRGSGEGNEYKKREPDRKPKIQVTVVNRLGTLQMSYAQQTPELRQKQVLLLTASFRVQLSIVRAWSRGISIVLAFHTTHRFFITKRKGHGDGQRCDHIPRDTAR